MTNPICFIDEQGNPGINILSYDHDGVRSNVIWWHDHNSPLFGYNFSSAKVQGEYRGQIPNLEGVLLYSRINHKLQLRHWRLVHDFDSITDRLVQPETVVAYKAVLARLGEIFHHLEISLIAKDIFERYTKYVHGDEYYALLLSLNSPRTNVK